MRKWIQNEEGNIYDLALFDRFYIQSLERTHFEVCAIGKEERITLKIFSDYDEAKAFMIDWYSRLQAN